MSMDISVEMGNRLAKKALSLPSSRRSRVADAAPCI